MAMTAAIDSDDRAFWSGKRVFVTGHTGFKGTWLTLWLNLLGADVTGYALPAPPPPSLHALTGDGGVSRAFEADVRDAARLAAALAEARPDVVFHLAAQPLVRASYARPSETFETNVMGTVHLLEAIRLAAGQGVPIRAAVIVTSDKCYDNREQPWGYREIDPLGGRDPYSASKACAELVSAAYVHSYFSPDRHAGHGVAIATARAGNVIGGGDWAEDRLVPDAFRALLGGTKMKVRHPGAVRPWQHVLEPIGGYLLLARRLAEGGARFDGSWNFGPADADVRTVREVLGLIGRRWDREDFYEPEDASSPHEAGVLKLDGSKTSFALGWRPRWPLPEAVERTAAWFEALRDGEPMRPFTERQIMDYVHGSRETVGAAPPERRSEGGDAG